MIRGLSPLFLGDALSSLQEVQIVTPLHHDPVFYLRHDELHLAQKDGGLALTVLKQHFLQRPQLNQRILQGQRDGSGGGGLDSLGG